MILKITRIRVFWCMLCLLILLLPVLRCEAEETVSGGNAVMEAPEEMPLREELPIEQAPPVIEKVPVEQTVPVTELDLGDCPRKMMVGTSQVISVLVIPVDATVVEFTYQSDNPEVASMNALGRLTAHKVGSARITVFCGSVNNSFVVTVVDEPSDIVVQDIEIDEIEDVLKVDSKINISATVLPFNATNATVYYKSLDTQIATVNAMGQVKGIAPGQVTIEVSAGNVVKTLFLTVEVATTQIQLNSDYILLKPEETFQLEAIVHPQTAPADITYKSLDTDVITVSDSGLVTAKKYGDAAIVVSNDDLQKTVMVIVNEEDREGNSTLSNNTDSKNEDKEFPDEVKVEKYPTISTEMLKYFYEKEKILSIEGDGYTLYVDGKKIVNFENPLNTELLFREQEDGISFVVNEGNNLCGKIILELGEKVTNHKYLYLYNEAKQQYERLETEDISWLTIDTGGQYLLSSQELSEFEINPLAVMIGIIILLLGGVAYILFKKRYWFW